MASGRTSAMAKVIAMLMMTTLFFVYIVCGLLADDWLSGNISMGLECVAREFHEDRAAISQCREWDYREAHPPWYVRLYDRAWGERR